MKILWNISTYVDRLRILIGLGADKDEAEKFAQRSWNSLPMRLRYSLEREFANTGKPEAE